VGASRLLQLLLGAELGRVTTLALALRAKLAFCNVRNGVEKTHAVGGTGRETSVANTADLLVALWVSVLFASSAGGLGCHASSCPASR
jgi:hypothetical protein